MPEQIHAGRLHEATKQLLTQRLRLRRVRPPENSPEGLRDTFSQKLIYDEDGSDRGAEVVWRAINAYIASGAGNRKRKK